MLFNNIKHQDLEIPHFISHDVKDLLVKLLEKDPSKRLGKHGAEEVKKHKWFKGINWTDVFNKKIDPPIPYLK